MNAKKAINQLQLACGRAGYPVTVNTRRQYGKGRLFILYTIYDVNGNKLFSTYRPHEAAVIMGTIYNALQEGKDALQEAQKKAEAMKEGKDSV